MSHFRRMIPALALLLVPALPAQTTCPPLPEGAVCGRYHYHVSVWNVDSRTYSEVAGTGPFVSAAACDKFRADALRENAALVDFMKTTKIDTSMMPNRYSACHCDRTDEKGNAAYVDPNTRAMHVRAQQDAAWSLRERLLFHDTAGAAGHLNVLFGRSERFDRFLREAAPPRVTPTATSSRAPATLLDSKAGAPAGVTAIAANISLVPVPVPAAPAAAPAGAQPTAAKPPEPQPAGTPATPPPAETHPPASPSRSNE